MKIKYSLTRLDTISGSIGYIAYNPTLWMFVKMIASIIGIVEVFKASQRFMEAGDLDLRRGLIIITFMILVPVAFSCIAVILFAISILLERLFSFRKGIICEHKLEIDSEGLWERTAYNNTFHEWKSVCSVHENSSFYFIRVYIPKASVHIIPKNRSESKDDLVAFIEVVRDRIRDTEHLRDKRGKPLNSMVNEFETRGIFVTLKIR